ncbi:hypothetical protein HYH03_011579 [Edaphochlamys debaryana]|uniref:TLC domain-containing protein n=1 Tax=Edaphochlamys debaryana TaxID=47281 RepID=A0A835XTG1_9CHLO|nr:hypothetical protein HYH03_011579 [Edaphochlamys debaryana]|eukprot:KAG2489948.1 hypothetical protein HYH03_011579 [Edaphochlamys debaryana]
MDLAAVDAWLRPIHENLSEKAQQIASLAAPYLDKAGPPGTFARDYAGIAATGLTFWFVELLVHALLVPVIVSVLRTSGGLEPKKAKGVATQTVSRIIGSIHNTIQVPLGVMMLLDARFRSDRVHFHTPLSYAVCYISAGYFLHDLVFCIIRYHLEGPFYLIHALVCHSAYSFGAISGYLHYHAAGFLMWEISTPFVNLRWFMYKAGWAHVPLYLANGMAMIAVFFGCRIAWGFPESFTLAKDVLAQRFPGSPFPAAATAGYCAAAVIMCSLNSFWFYKMLSAALAIFIKGKKSHEVHSRVKGE